VIRTRAALLSVAGALLAACSDDEPPRILETTVVTDTNDVAGPYEVLSVIHDDSGVSGAWVFYSVDGRRNFEAVSMVPRGPEAWVGAIPGFPLGTRVDYYVVARDRTANVGTDPAPAPPNAYCFLVGTLPSRPELLLVHPARGPTTGGTLLSLIGSDFRPGARVFVESAEAESVTVHDSTFITAVTPAGEPGLADVTVQNPTRAELGDAACARQGPDDPPRATLPDSFLYVLPPTPMGIVPDHGPTAGGTTVTVSGRGFVPESQVTFDGAPASCTFVSSEALSCITPPGDPGPADVHIENPDGLTGFLPGGFVYVPPPEVFAVEPPRGPDTGGTPVTILGRAFQPGAVVFFDNLALDAIAFVDSQTLTGLTPAHAPGFVDVRVRNPDGQEGRLVRGYQYFGPPRIDAIVPPQGPTTGGQRVVITGTSFVPGVTVTFDGFPAVIESVSDTEIVVRTPPHPEGPVAVVVTNPDGRSAAGAYTYVPAPEIEGLSPACGPAAGGTVVTVQGRNFQTGAVVLFGDAPAAATNVLSAGVIQATTAPHAPGLVRVLVRNPDGGESPTPGTFTFVPAPQLISVTPAAMLLCGGTEITLRGTDFLPGATVTVGGAPCTSPRVLSSTEIRCNAPPASPGPQRVVVTNHECIDQSSTAAIDLSYERLTLSPTGGLVSGFTNVRVSHTLGLSRPVLAVTFGGTPALEVRNQAGRALAQSPPHEVGGVDVQVTLEGCPPEGAAQRFQYRVFVDRTAGRIPHPACLGDPPECHANYLRFGDLNRDGLNDFVQASGGIDATSRQSNLVYLNDPARPGFFRATVLPFAGGEQNHARVDLADIDGDSDLDLLFAGSGGGSLFVNDGQGGFSRAPFSATLERLGGSFDAQFADVNGDGRPDILFLEIGIEGRDGQPAQNGPDHVFLNQGGGAFTELAGAFPSTFSVHDHRMGIGDFTGDGRPDVAIVVDSHYRPRPPHRLLFGDGTGRFRLEAEPDLSDIFGDIFGIEVGDFDGDGRLDLFLPVEGRVTANGGCGIIIEGQANVLLLNDGTGHFVNRSDLLPPHTDPNIQSASFDVDGDGDIDLVTVGYGAVTRIYVNEGNGRFHDASAALLDPPTCSLSAAGAAIDGTGVPALLVGGVYPTRLWMQTSAP
jgi:hypothetical protein